MGPTFRFLHAADLHLDRPFRGCARVDPAWVPLLRDASLDAMDRLIETAIRERVAFVILAGGICEGSAVCGLRPQVRFRAALERLSSEGIQTLLALGLGDPSEGWEAIEDWPKGVHIFDDAAIDRVLIERGGEVLARVFGMSYPTEASLSDLVESTRRESDPLGVAIVCHSHGLPPDPEGDSAPGVSLGDLVQSGVSYWALGSSMQPAVLHRDPWVVQPGSPQGRGFEEADLGPHGAYLVEVKAGRVGEVRLISLDGVRTVRLVLEIGGIADLDALHAAVITRVEQLRGENPGIALMFRVILTGCSSVRSEVTDRARLMHYQERLGAELSLMEPAIGLEQLVDMTQPVMDLGALRGRGDFSAAVLEQGEAMAADPEVAAAFLRAHGQPLPLPEIARWLDAPLGDEPSTAIQKATMLAIHELSSQGRED